MINLMLITRPENDEITKYLCQWSSEVIDDAEDKGIEVFDLRRGDASKDNVESYAESNDIDIFFFNGHGSEEIIGGHENPILIKNENEDITQDSIIYSRTCSSAKELGPSCIEKGCNAFLGYNRPFSFISNKRSSDPLNDEIAKPVLKCSNEVVKSLLKGKTPQETYERVMNLYEEKINSILNSSNYPLAGYHLLVALLNNKKALTVLE